MSLTPMQLDLLKILELTGKPLTSLELRQLSGDDSQTLHDIHDAATVLARRGFVVKQRAGEVHRVMTYQVSGDGKHALRELTKPRSGIKKRESP